MLSHAYKRKRNCAPRLDKQICITVFLLLRYMRYFENNTAMVGTTQMQQKRSERTGSVRNARKTLAPASLLRFRAGFILCDTDTHAATFI